MKIEFKKFVLKGNDQIRVFVTHIFLTFRNSITWQDI